MSKKNASILGAIVFVLLAGFYLSKNKENSVTEGENMEYTEVNGEFIIDANGKQVEVPYAEEITVNNDRITVDELDLLAELNDNVEPERGDYWYDTRSGLYGKIGGGALGVMQAGLNFAEMHGNVSNGDTGVFVNGREITRDELNYLQSVVGPLSPGRYWLDASGNAGVMGSDQALVNLYATGRNGGGGDNFWSSGVYSAGNYYEGNNQGYVNVPGYGAYGYGF